MEEHTVQLVKELSLSRNDLISLGRLADQQKISEEAQEFVFSIRDYTDALGIVTDLLAEPAGEMNNVSLDQVSGLLADQRQLITNIISSLHATVEKLEAPDKTVELSIEQSAGSMRRLIGSLTGLLELNSILLQENMAFQREIKELAIKPVAIVAEPVEEKPGFFKRLFGK